MKKTLLAVILAAGLIFLGCLPDVVDTNYRAETAYDNQDHAYSASPYNRVKIDTENGDISSSVSYDDSIQIELRLRASGKTEEDALEHLQYNEVRIDEDTFSGEFSVEIIMPKNDKRSYGCDVILSLPESLFVDLNSSNGDVSVEGHEAGYNVRTSNGEVESINTIGAADIESSNGRIDIDNHQGNINASSTNGAIETVNTVGDADLETSNGIIDIDNHEGDIDAISSNGVIEAKVLMPDTEGRCRLETTNGDIRLAVPATVGAHITLRTTNENKVEIIDLYVDKTTNEQNNIEGYMGDGSGSIYIETSNEDIILERL